MSSADSDRVSLAVVRFLGWSGIIGLAGVIMLVYTATRYETIDPSTVALVAGVSTLVGGVFGALGAMLATTGKGAPQDVQVVNQSADPIPVTEE